MQLCLRASLRGTTCVLVAAQRLLSGGFVKKNFWYFLIFLFSFLLAINLKLLIVHAEIKIVNKEAATKRNTLLHAQRQLYSDKNNFMSWRLNLN